MSPMAPFLFAKVMRNKKYQLLARLAYSKELVECKILRMIIAIKSRLPQSYLGSRPFRRSTCQAVALQIRFKRRRS
jgi:hypothetical protein